MLNSFYKKFSLNNLKKDKPQGQISTLLILIIVVILIMILTTVNLGQLSISTTNLSNVADSSSLYLASQLATRSYALYKALGNSTSKCQSGGFGGLLGAIIGAIIVIIITVATYGAGTPYTVGAILAANTGTIVAAGAIGGAIGGALGSAYSGTGVLQGALQGFIIGASIGSAASAGAGLGAIQVDPSTGVVMGSGTTPLVLADGTRTVLVLAETAGYTAAGGGILAASSATYNAYVTDQNQSAAFAAATKMLNGLPDYDLVRESVFLQVFSQTVDDPNRDMDTSDLNGNGLVDEKIPHFLYWWDGRMKQLKGIIPDLKNITNTFFNGTLESFKSYIQSQLSSVVVISEFGTDFSQTTTPGMLSKAGTGTDTTVTVDGSIAEVARALNPDFWNATTNGSFDGIVSGFNDFIAEAKTMQAIDINQLTANWQIYIDNYYNEHYGEPVLDENGNPVLDADGNPVTVTDDYHRIDEVKGFLKNWQAEIVAKRNALPSCQMGSLFVVGEAGNYCTPCGSTYCANNCLVDNNSVPCKFDFTPKGGTLDNNVDDEITLALNDIDTLIAKLNNFQDVIKQYIRDMENAYNAIETGHGGINPATYPWTDSRGDHSIKAEVGLYQLPSTIKTESGSWVKKEVCIRMANYYDNDGTNSWVRIVRQDPKDKEVKSGKVNLGMWNPFFNGTITKTGKAYYSYDRVGLAHAQ